MCVIHCATVNYMYMVRCILLDVAHPTNLRYLRDKGDCSRVIRPFYTLPEINNLPKIWHENVNNQQKLDFDVKS
jgi:hypothetical protein